jgi:nitroreductase
VALADDGPTGHVTAADVSPDMAVQNMLLAARALGLRATLTTLYLSFEKEAEAAFGLPADWHSYAILPVWYPVGRFGPARRVALADVVFGPVGSSVPGSVAAQSLRQSI